MSLLILFGAPPLAVTGGAECAVQVELELSPGVWTDVTADVRAQEPIRWRRGINGSGPTDRIASTGILTFALNNLASNSGGLTGYYSPGHTNCRTGFTTRIGARLSVIVETVTYRHFTGTLRRIVPVPGKSTYLTHCTVTDWIDDAARAYISPTLPMQVNKRSNEILTALLSAIATPPAAAAIATGQGTFPYALDNLQDEHTKCLRAIAAVVMSELGFAYVKGDGTFTFEDRHARAYLSSNTTTLADSMVGVEAERNDDLVLDGVQVVVHPRRVDTTATTVLARLTNVESAIAFGDTITLTARYRDPENRAERVGGMDMVAPVQLTDYTMNSAVDGLGSDATGRFTVSAQYGANSVEWTITNIGQIGPTGLVFAGAPAYVTLVQARGRGLYDYVEIASSAGDVTGNAMLLDLPFENDAVIGAGVAEWIKHLYGVDITLVSSVTFVGNKSPAHMVVAAGLDIGTRIGLIESTTGLTDVASVSPPVWRGFFINGIEGEITEGPWFTMRWLLAPADRYRFWILNQAGASELDVTTVLGFV
jgi:hypothetical protein